MVGGAVRNALLGEPLGDIDIATTALPEEVIRRVQAAGFKAVPTGIEHGTVTVVVDGQPFEVTTLREDVETFGRHAKVAFGRDWRRDAERRDFTMNALSVDARRRPSTTMSAGSPISTARRVRFIGDAGDSASPRIICASCASSASTPPMATARPTPAGSPPASPAAPASTSCRASACAWSCSSSCSRRHAVPTLAVMTEAGLLGTVLGGVPLLASFANMVKLEAALGLAPDAVRRLGALARHRSTRTPSGCAQRLRLTNAEHERLASMADGWWRISPAMGEAEARVLLYRLGPERFVDRVLLAWARSPEGAATTRPGARSPPCRSAGPRRPFRSRPPTSSRAACRRGPRSAPPCAAAEEAWIAAGFPATRRRSRRSRMREVAKTK